MQGMRQDAFLALGKKVRVQGAYLARVSERARKVLAQGVLRRAGRA